MRDATTFREDGSLIADDRSLMDSTQMGLNVLPRNPKTGGRSGSIGTVAQGTAIPSMRNLTSRFQGIKTPKEMADFCGQPQAYVYLQRIRHLRKHLINCRRFICGRHSRIYRFAHNRWRHPWGQRHLCRGRIISDREIIEYRHRPRINRARSRQIADDLRIEQRISRETVERHPCGNRRDSRGIGAVDEAVAIDVAEVGVDVDAISHDAGKRSAVYRDGAELE